MSDTEFLILGIVVLSLSELFVERVRNKWRREAHYDCSECRVWDCPYHHCDHLRKKTKQP